MQTSPAFGRGGLDIMANNNTGVQQPKPSVILWFAISHKIANKEYEMKSVDVLKDEILELLNLSEEICPDQSIEYGIHGAKEALDMDMPQQDLEDLVSRRVADTEKRKGDLSIVDKECIEIGAYMDAIQTKVRALSSLGAPTELLENEIRRISARARRVLKDGL